jgi:hypothetical protein
MLLLNLISQRLEKEYGMKQSSFRAICLILMACIAVFKTFGDNVTSVIETRVLETFFDDESPFEWRVEASRFATNNDNGVWPQVRSFLPAWPAMAYGRGNPAEENQQRSLGVRGSFDRRGYNWIDIFPVEAGADEDASGTVITVPGRARAIDMWVWGSNRRYHLEAYFRDHVGGIHVIELGTINHQGWRNMRANVPARVPQSRIGLPRFAALEFLKFRIWTEPTERVDDFFVYFHNFRVLTDVFEMPFDGDEVATPEFIQENWNGGE